MLSAAAAPALAAEEFSYENEAEILHDLGLYSGISDTTFDPDLGSPLDRLTGMSLMLKIFGLWEEAEAMSDEDVEAALDYFEDKDRIPEWGRNVAAHVIVSELGQSFCPNGEFTADEMDAQSYYAVMLKA
jgi:hypothetical protein